MSPWLWASLACNLLLAIGWFLTLGWGQDYRTTNKILRARVALLQDPDPVCGCTHHYSFHSEEDGCHYTVVHTKDGKFGIKHVMTTCACVQYTGPIPLPRIVAMERREPEQ